MEMKEVLAREGRGDVKNLLVYQMRDDKPLALGANYEKSVPLPLHTHRKPPKSPNALLPPTAVTPKKTQSPSRHSSKQSTGPRVRSASTGRDKKSELQARYWALLFGNLQRAVNEIYQTVECYENISSCQEAILVLENYVRDFKALSEWFKVSWDYESRPLQQRPNSLAWEVRKSNPVPRVRAKSLSSPTVSGKSSPCPCNSGKSSPCLGNLDQHSPRKGYRVNVRELFASSKRQHTDNLKEFEQEQQPPPVSPRVENQEEEETCHMILENRSHQYAQTDLEDDHLTLAGIREKMQREQEEREAQLRQEEELKRQQELARKQQEEEEKQMKEKELAEAQQKQHEIANEPTALEMTIKKLDDMENVFLSTNTKTEPTPPDTVLKRVQPLEEKPTKCEKPAAEGNKKATTLPSTAQNSPLKYSSVLNRPAAPANSNANTTKPTIVTNATNNTNPVKPVVNTKASTLRASAGRPINTVSTAKTSFNTTLKRSATTAAATSQKPPFAGGKALPRNRNSLPPRSVSSKPDNYGPPTNVASRLSARSRTMIEMNQNGGGPQKSANNLKRQTSITSRYLNSNNNLTSHKSSKDDIGSSTSTLKASNEKISSSRSSINQHPTTADDRKSEPKQMPSNNNDNNDGWLTVKNRRRSSMHWSSRFNQPTGYASLPTLALLDEKQSDEEQEVKCATDAKSKPQTNGHASKASKVVKQTQKIAPDKNNKTASSSSSTLRPEIKNAKAKVNSLPTQKKSSLPAKKETTPPLIARTSAAIVPTRQTNIKRQKSDLTGLKMTSLHKEYMRSEKLALRKQNNSLNGAAKSSELLNHYHLGSGDCSDINSSAETIVEAQSSLSPELTNSDISCGDHNKIDIKIQTNRDFSKTIGDLYKSIANKAENSLTTSSTSGPGALSSCDENDECDEHQRLLVEEQESLERQIRELESTEIDVDTETDETDCEVGILETDRDDEEEFGFHDGLDTSSVVFVPINGQEDDSNLSLETRYQALLSEMSWGEREEALATLQAYVSRHPGRAQELHQKLSSPSRRRSLQETLKKYQAKQARAQQKRENLKKEKAIKIQQLLARVEDVKAAKRQLIEDKRLKMEGRLQRAAENRELYLRQIIEKAHDEEKKLKEINFIKNIEAQNKRLDLIESSKETEGRLQDLEQERQKRLEEKAAKEAAVERRRQELEKERQRKLEKMNETRLEKEQRIGKMQEQKEKQRQALAREKARDREERLLALQVQQQQTTEELQRKILQKQKESARRHEENIEHIRQRALELTIPSRNVEENGLIRSEGEEQPAEDCDLSSTVSDVGSREHTRGYKKKMKKLKQRMSQGAEEYMKELQPVPLHMKRESQVPKYLNLVNKGGGSQGLERAIGQLLRIMAKAQVFDFQCFLLMDGLGTISSNVITKGMQEDAEVSKKAVVLAVQLYRNACTLCPQIARHAILGNTLVVLFDALFQSLQLPEEKSPQHPVELSTELMLACTVALSPSYTKKHTHPKVLERLPDLISYAVITGLIEILSRRCMKIRESIENHQSVVLSLLATLGFITRFIDVCPPGPTDPTRFLSAAKSTELFGSISMLYASVVPIGECIPPRTISLAAATFNLLVSMAVLDLSTFQEVMSSEAISLKFLDVVQILLKYCGNQTTAAKNSETQAVLIDLIATIGFFCANNKQNQDLLTSEQCSNIIKNLTKLPEHLNVVVYPCLVTVTFQNQEARNVISRDFNLEFLDEYSKSDKAKKNHLVALLKENT
ncbi:S phase cyclin A-associated protein in the endoplasmic reticulum [Lucilia cuprina]|uniref:S phase cyclin A-associated protein in the endoplasmic reticulum n=1 Tax=Lucilia cuprina TaxID=7375 RepID=UPI001F0677B0|nr:S phase cyclin A-associated protein in the endoplasmic reticulum [Lucilia cuprina]